MTPSTQNDIRNWFNEVYKKRGFDYLRPQVAYTIFLAHLQISTTNRLLDVACGLGLMLKTALDSDLDATGVDISDEAVSVCREFVPKAKVYVANAESLPFERNTFELITCLGSLERMMDLPKVLGELHRIGTNDAKYCFMVRNSKTFIWMFFKRFLGMQNHLSHQDAKSYEEWSAIFERAGFQIDTVARDHWPIMRWKRWLSLGIFPVDYTKPPSSPIPLRYATEFVFILRKSL